MAATDTQARSQWPARGIDALLVLVFVLIGRSAHAEGLSLLGILETWWPFLVGLALGWLIVTRWHRPYAIAWTAVVLWVATVAVGMLLRIISGQGVQWAFVIVAIITLGVFLLGWRLIAAWIFHARAR